MSAATHQSEVHPPNARCSVIPHYTLWNCAPYDQLLPPKRSECTHTPTIRLAAVQQAAETAAPAVEETEDTVEETETGTVSPLPAFPHAPEPPTWLHPPLPWVVPSPSAPWHVVSLTVQP